MMGRTKLGLAMALAAMLSSPASADSIKEFWARAADRENFQTAKSSLSLEMCLGLEMSDWLGPPSVLHGEAHTIITVATDRAVAGGARIIDHGNIREVIVGARPAWKNRMTEAARRCV